MARENGLCYRCLGKHLRQYCHSKQTCASCEATHHTLLHLDSASSQGAKSKTSDSNSQSREQDTKRSTLCTVYGNGHLSAKSCSRTFLVTVKAPRQKKVLKCYAIVDDQSNSTFADPRLLDFFSIKKPTTSYTLTTLSGEKIHREGRIVQGLKVKGMGERQTYRLPTTLENDMIPDTREEVATPEDLEQSGHLAEYAHRFLPVDKEAEVLLLIGRDAGELMSVNQKGSHYPYALQTPLGWAVVGTTCQHSDPTKERKALRTSVEHDHFNAKLCFEGPHSRRNCQRCQKMTPSLQPDMMASWKRHHWRTRGSWVSLARAFKSMNGAI